MEHFTHSFTLNLSLEVFDNAPLRLVNTMLASSFTTGAVAKMLCSLPLLDSRVAKYAVSEKPDASTFKPGFSFRDSMLLERVLVCNCSSVSDRLTLL
jgi:hypothetical protein